MPASIRERVTRWWLDLPIRVKALFVVAIPLLCLLLQVAWLERLQRAQRAAAAMTLHTEQVKLTARRLLSSLLDAETGVRGYAIGHTADFLEPYNSAVTAVPETLAQLRELVADNAEQGRRLEEIARLAQEKLRIGSQNIRLVQQSTSESGGGQALVESTAKGKQVMDELRLRIAEFLDAEDQLLPQRSQRLQSKWRQTDAVLWGGLLAGLLGGFLAVWLLGRGVSDRLALLAGRAAVFGRGTLPPVRVYEADEIGKLGKALFEAYRLAHEHAEKLKESERQVRAQKDALEANAELEAFSYSVSHDLRAPLRHVDGFSRILLEDHGPQLAPEAHRLLARICDGTRRMGVLIDELLNLGRIGRRPLEVQIAGLGALVEQARSELGSEISDREIEWHIGALPFAECDSGLLRQVFTNLLSNAVKYTRPRKPAVIEVGEAETQGKRAIFVRDNGVGFSMKYADKLFGVFQRLHRQEDFEGTGVGLAGAARIIQRHGGRIWAEAELDRGACFYFTLPSLEEQADRIAVSDASRNGVADEARS